MTGYSSSFGSGDYSVSNGTFTIASSSGAWPNTWVSTTVAYPETGQPKFEVEEPDLAEAIQAFYMEILDQPLTAAMIHRWHTLQELLQAAVDCAKKYPALIQQELDTKLDL